MLPLLEAIKRGTPTHFLFPSPQKTDAHDSKSLGLVLVMTTPLSSTSTAAQK